MKNLNKKDGRLFTKCEVISMICEFVGCHPESYNGLRVKEFMNKKERGK